MLYDDRCDVYTAILLQLCVILEPMQELMSRHKAYALSPRDCLKTTLFQKWQRIVAPPGKRGRRTVALHEKHQPVDAERSSILIDNVKSVFAIRGTAHDRCRQSSLPLCAAILGSAGFSLSSVRLSAFVFKNPLAIRYTFLLTVLLD